MDATGKKSSILTPIIIESPGGGLDTRCAITRRGANDIVVRSGSPLSIDISKSPDSQNVIFQGGLIRVRPCIWDKGVTFMTTLPSGVQKIERITVNGTTPFNGYIAATKTNLYCKPLTSATWTSLGALTNYTSFVQPFPQQFKIFLQKVFYCECVNAVKYWDGNIAGSFANLATAGAPQAANFMEVFANRLFFAGIKTGGVAYPNSYCWTDYLTYNNFTTGSSGYDTIAEDEDAFITGLRMMDDKLYLFTMNKIWVISEVGYPYYFTRKVFSEMVGCIAPGSIQKTQAGLVFLGSDRNVWCIPRGGGLPVIISKEIFPLLTKYFDLNLNTVSNIWNAFVPIRWATAYVAPQDGLYYLLAPQEYSSGVWGYNSGVVWNYEENNWSSIAYTVPFGALTAISSFSFPVMNSEGWESALGGFGNGRTCIFGTLRAHSDSISLRADNYYDITPPAKFVGANIDWYYTTKPFFFGGDTFKIESVEINSGCLDRATGYSLYADVLVYNDEMDVEAEGASSSSPNYSYPNVETIPISFNEPKACFRSTGRIFQIKLRPYRPGTTILDTRYSDISRILVKVLPRGERWAR
jgi:hypothetical protein